MGGSYRRRNRSRDGAISVHAGSLEAWIAMRSDSIVDARNWHSHASDSVRSGGLTFGSCARMSHDPGFGGATRRSL